MRVLPGNCGSSPASEAGAAEAVDDFFGIGCEAYHPLTQELDLRGLKCPLPVLRTRKALRALPEGSELKVICSDPLAPIDIPHLIAEEGHGLQQHTIDTDGVSTFHIKRRV